MQQAPTSPTSVEALYEAFHPRLKQEPRPTPLNFEMDERRWRQFCEDVDPTKLDYLFTVHEAGIPSRSNAVATWCGIDVSEVINSRALFVHTTTDIAYNRALQLTLDEYRRASRGLVPTGLEGKIQGRRADTIIMDDPAAEPEHKPLPTLTLVIDPANQKSRKADHLRIASDLKKIEAKTLREATFLISDTRSDNPAHVNQTRALIGAIERKSGRKLPSFRLIQVAGADDREDRLQIAHVSLVMERKDIKLPVQMIVGVTQLLNHQGLLIICQLTELVQPGAFISIAFENANAGHMRAYRVIEEKPEGVPVGTTKWACVPVVEEFVDAETEGVDLTDGLPIEDA